MNRQEETRNDPQDCKQLVYLSQIVKFNGSPAELIQYSKNTNLWQRQLKKYTINNFNTHSHQHCHSIGLDPRTPNGRGGARISQRQGLCSSTGGSTIVKGVVNYLDPVSVDNMFS